MALEEEKYINEIGYDQLRLRVRFLIISKFKQKCPIFQKIRSITSPTQQASKKESFVYRKRSEVIYLKYFPVAWRKPSRNMLRETIHMDGISWRLIIDKTIILKPIQISDPIPITYRQIIASQQKVGFVLAQTFHGRTFMSIRRFRVPHEA